MSMVKTLKWIWVAAAVLGQHPIMVVIPAGMVVTVRLQALDLAVAVVAGLEPRKTVPLAIMGAQVTGETVAATAPGGRVAQKA